MGTAKVKESGRKQAAIKTEGRGAASQNINGMHTGGGNARHVRGLAAERQLARRENQM